MLHLSTIALVYLITLFIVIVVIRRQTINDLSQVVLLAFLSTSSPLAWINQSLKQRFDGECFLFVWFLKGNRRWLWRRLDFQVFSGSKRRLGVGGSKGGLIGWCLKVAEGLFLFLYWVTPAASHRLLVLPYRSLRCSLPICHLLLSTLFFSDPRPNTLLLRQFLTLLIILTSIILDQALTRKQQPFLG